MVLQQWEVAVDQLQVMKLTQYPYHTGSTWHRSQRDWRQSWKSMESRIAGQTLKTCNDCMKALNLHFKWMNSMIFYSFKINFKEFLAINECCIVSLLVFGGVKSCFFLETVDYLTWPALSTHFTTQLASFVHTKKRNFLKFLAKQRLIIGWC